MAQRISVTAFIGKTAPLLKGLPGFKPDRNGYRVTTSLRYDGKGKANGGRGNLVAAEAWPWEKLSVEAKGWYPIDRFVMCAMVTDSFSDEGYSDYVMTIGPDGQLLDAPVIPFTVTKRVNGQDMQVKEPWLVNIESPLTQVMGVFDKNGETVFYLDTFSLGKAEGGRVKIHCEPLKWPFPTELNTAALTKKFPAKAEIIKIIVGDVNRNCMDKVKKEFFLAMAEAMAVVYMRLFGFKASLPKPEAKVQPAPAPAPKVEAPAAAAPEAPAPEASAPATEEPVPMPGENDEFEPPDLRAVPPLTEEQQATAAQQVDPGRKGTGRSRKTKTTKVKGKERATG